MADIIRHYKNRGGARSVVRSAAAGQVQYLPPPPRQQAPPSRPPFLEAIPPRAEQSFEAVCRILHDFRDATGYRQWRKPWGSTKCKQGWTRFNLDSYTSIHEVGSCAGIAVNALGLLCALELPRCNLSGSLPPSLAGLHTLEELNLGGNPGLSGELPPTLGSLSPQTVC